MSDGRHAGRNDLTFRGRPVPSLPQHLSLLRDGVVRGSSRQLTVGRSSPEDPWRDPFTILHF